MKNYTQKLPNIAALLAGNKTYYKDPTFSGFMGVRLPNITVHTRAGGNCSVTLGDESSPVTITEDQAFLYIDTQGGYSDTP